MLLLFFLKKQHLFCVILYEKPQTRSKLVKKQSRPTATTTKPQSGSVTKTGRMGWDGMGRVQELDGVGTRSRGPLSVHSCAYMSLWN